MEEMTLRTCRRVEAALGRQLVKTNDSSSVFQRAPRARSVGSVPSRSRPFRHGANSLSGILERTSRELLDLLISLKPPFDSRLVRSWHMSTAISSSFSDLKRLSKVFHDCLCCQWEFARIVLGGSMKNIID